MAFLRNEKKVDGKSSLKNFDYEALISSFEYSEKSIKIARYLTTLKKPKNISIPEFRKFKKKALKYGIYKRKL